MQQCPACSNLAVPGWRRFFSRRDRFRCPRCKVWLCYRRDARPAWLASRIGNLWIRTLVLALCIQAVMLACVLTVVYAGCYLRRIPGGLLLSAELVALCAMIVLSERSILRRLRLSVADRQEGRPSLDSLKDLADVVRSAEGRGMFLSSLLLVALIFAGMTTWKPAVVALMKVMPPLGCQKAPGPGHADAGQR